MENYKEIEIEMIECDDKTEINETSQTNNNYIPSVKCYNVFTCNEDETTYNYVVISPDDFLDDYDIVSLDDDNNDNADNDDNMSVITDDSTKNMFIKYVTLIENTFNYFNNMQQVNDNKNINKMLDVLDEEINALKI